jgi:hypothetical protein
VRLPGGIPLEEVLFFVVVPICAILTLEAVRARRRAWPVGDEPQPPTPTATAAPSSPSPSPSPSPSQAEAEAEAPSARADGKPSDGPT